MLSNFYKLPRIILRLVKAIRAARSMKAIEEVSIFYNKNKAHGTLLFYSIALLLIIVYCSFGFYNFESPLNDQVVTFGDALWWALIPVTSAGYGNIYPTTTNGKIIAIILTLGGMGLFSVLTADILSIFVKQKQ